MVVPEESAPNIAMFPPRSSRTEVIYGGSSTIRQVAGSTWAHRVEVATCYRAVAGAW